MVKYAAFLRGIAPTNPNMKNAKLREVFERAGFKNVQTVISSGNVLFETDEKDIQRLETAIETALPEQLGFYSTTIILSHAGLQQVSENHAFGSEQETQQIKLIVAFTKNKVDPDADFPHAADEQGYGILGTYERAIYSRVDLSSAKTPQLMRWLEKEYSKEITTRTWNTVQRILKKLDEM